MDVHPGVTAVREPSRGRSDRLSDREIPVMVRHLEKTAADPVLEEAGIDIDQRRALYARKQLPVDLLMEVEQEIGPNALADILDAELEDGFNELCCHPGYVDRELASSYSSERQTELTTLCDPGVAALLSERGIRLVTFREVSSP